MDFLSNFREEFLYNFINYSFDNNTLKLRPVYINGKLLNQKSKFIKVSDMLRIRNTRFPDIDEIMVKFDLKGKRPAEIKFRTSQFEYHSDKKYKEQYNEFKIKNGCIIVAKHDYLPIGLEDDVIDVFELNFEELRLYGKSNYDKLLNLQVREHSIQKIWLMETSKNFYEGADGVKPAIESHIWCPTEQLTSLDLGVNDIVIFIKTKGASKQKVQKFYIPENWVLDELFIARVKKPIMNRKEYCQINNISYMTPLWYDETLEGYSNPRVKKGKIIQQKENGDGKEFLNLCRYIIIII